MLDDLAELTRTLDGIVAGLSPAARRRATRAIAAELRRAQAERIAAQRDPDGEPFVPRKPRFRDHHRTVAGKAQQRQGATGRRAMFAKLRTTRWLKAKSDADRAEVGFSGNAARIASVHQDGLRDKVDPKRSAAEATYPIRRLLGLAPADRERLLDRLLAMVSS